MQLSLQKLIMTQQSASAAQLLVASFVHVPVLVSQGWFSHTGQHTPEMQSPCCVQLAPRASVPVDVTTQRPVVGEQVWPGEQLDALQPGSHNCAWQMVPGGLHWASPLHCGLVATQ